MKAPEGKIPFDELTRDLAVDSFEEQASRLLLYLDAEDIGVACSFQRSHPAGGTQRTANLRSFYRREVQRLPVMGREEELRFCMGVELLWRRLKAARRAAGFQPEEVEVYPGTEEHGCLQCAEGREAVCAGCAPAALEPRLRVRLRARHFEFIAARNELIERNLHIVFRLLERYRGVAVSAEDLIQEANMSLFKAVEGFDFRRGVRFKTYASYWVNQAFLNAIYNQSRTVRVPAYIQKAMKKIHDAARTVGGGLQDQEKLSRVSGIPVELMNAAISGNRFTLSLDKTMDGESGARILDFVTEEPPPPPPADQEEERILARHLQDALERLSKREQAVLRMRFGLDGGEAQTLAVVGERLKISLERVRQIQKSALDKIRRSRQSDLLEQFA